MRFAEAGTAERKCFAEKGRDSNGAGDSYAAGFLDGLSCGLGVQECGQIASTVATEVVQVTGAKLTPEHWKKVLPRIREIENRKTSWPE